MDTDDTEKILVALGRIASALERQAKAIEEQTVVAAKRSASLSEIVANLELVLDRDGKARKERMFRTLEKSLPSILEHFVARSSAKTKDR